MQIFNPNPKLNQNSRTMVVNLSTHDATGRQSRLCPQTGEPSHPREPSVSAWPQQLSIQVYRHFAKIRIWLVVQALDL